MNALPEQLLLRPTVIGGVRYDDDYQVIWDGIRVGRILKQPGVPNGQPNWSWSVAFPNKPQAPWQRGRCDDLAESQRRFRVAWADTRRQLDDAAIAAARRVIEDIATRPWNRGR